MKYLLMISLWIIWCAIHSGMITLRFNLYLKKRFPRYYRFYRLFFNLVALATLIPLVRFSHWINGPLLYRLDGYLIPIQVLLLALAVLLFASGCLKYDMLQFFGIRQIVSGKSFSTLSKNGEIDTSGILRMTRHPWYLATIIVVWFDSREIYFSTLIVKILLTIYVIIGTVLEERKLLAEIGDGYRQYKADVSMLFPAKWIYGKFTGFKKGTPVDR